MAPATVGGEPKRRELLGTQVARERQTATVKSGEARCGARPVQAAKEVEGTGKII